MAQRDIIVIGASAGGVEAIRALSAQFPPELPAAVFVVVHLSPMSRSYLPEILSRAGPLPAVHAQDGTPIRHGTIYVAPPDHHLVVERDHVHLSVGPKEQHQRPCINVTFRSAALAYGERAVGVVLTGTLDDGTAGLWEIRRRGGIAVVQSPEEALFPSMPLSALREIEVDHTVRLAELGPLLTRLAVEGDSKAPQADAWSTNMESRLTDLTCPDCRGTIWEAARGNGVEFRCRVGHTYSAKSMLATHYAAQEKALYAALVALEEGASLANRLAERIGPELCDDLEREARERASEAEAIRKLLYTRQPFCLD